MRFIQRRGALNALRGDTPDLLAAVKTVEDEEAIAIFAVSILAYVCLTTTASATSLTAVERAYARKTP